jgi:RHS repeat-associated protein
MFFKGILFSNIYMRYPSGIDINRKLTSITESSADTTDGYYKAQAGTYNYTQDGSMKSDGNKNLTLAYNPLGLIAKANTNGAINDYLYTASGQKLSMSSGGTTYSYRGGIVYASTNTTDQIEQIATAEGRWLPKEALSSFKADGTKSVAAKYGRYEFMMKDHLGNNRLAFRCIEIENATAITQAYPAIVTAEYQYDAWGLSIENQMMASSFTAQFGKFAATNRYKYNDKEYISDSKLYDYGARHYDPVVGRWWAVDPLAEDYQDFSPYNFVENNPLRFIDPDGNGPTDIVILGKNNSSLTVKTDLIDVKINAGSVVGDLGGNYTLSGTDILITALDIVGVVDPTPASDLLSAKLSADKGDWWGAGASTLGATLPYLGDLAKGPKIIKGLEKISDAIHGNSKLSQKVQHGYEIYNKKTGEVLEYGISGQKRNQTQVASGSSPRINQKIKSKYKNDPDIDGRVIEENIPNRQDALDWEKSKVNEFKKTNNGISPPRQIRPN